jgi:hypothetical protein
MSKSPIPHLYASNLLAEDGVTENPVHVPNSMSGSVVNGDRKAFVPKEANVD